MTAYIREAKYKLQVTSYKLHYHQYLGFSRYFVVEPIVFYEVVIERVYAEYGG